MESRQSITNGSLAGKRALVTGASRGLGAEIARRLARSGAGLVLVARDRSALATIENEIRSHADFDPARQSVHAMVTDLADRKALDEMLDRCQRDWGPVQIVVNNAAVQGPIGTFESVDFDEWRAVFESNFFAIARICQRVLPDMRKNHWGKIISLSGGGATSPRPDVSAYGVSKCAVVRFSETIADELRGSGIDVNCIAPGAMNTRMLQELLAAGPDGARREYDKALKQRESGGSSPVRAADLIAFLASPASDGISGRLISAVWDPWETLADRRDYIAKSDIYTLRRIVPEDRGFKW